MFKSTTELVIKMRFLLVETAAPFLGKTIEFAGNVLTLPRKYEGEVIKYFSLH